MADARSLTLLLTCEHASNAWPSRWVGPVKPPPHVLNSHRGWDPGALDLARRCRRVARGPLLAGRWSRLLVELNRSTRHSSLWSEYTRGLPDARRQTILAAVYDPFRQRTLELLRNGIRRTGRVIHLSVHTFAPRLRGWARDADIGLLYDPARNEERRFCQRWAEALKAAAAPLRVRFNYPYRGSADGHTSGLRRLLPETCYLGIELELNQKHVTTHGTEWRELQTLVACTLRMTLQQLH